MHVLEIVGRVLIMEKVIIEPERKDDLIVGEVRSMGDLVTNCIYGCGNIAQSLCAYLESHGIAVAFFVVDDQYYAEGGLCGGLEIKKLSDLYAAQGNVNVFVGFSNVSKAMDNLRPWIGCLNVYSISNPFGYLKPLDLNAKYYEEHREEFESALGLFEDDLSKDIFTAYLNTRINLNAQYLSPFGGCKTYFGNEIVELSGNEAYVDCGAYDGDSVRDFINETNRMYDKIYAIEPDPENFKRLRSYVEDNQLKNVTLLNIGLWNMEGKLGFSEENGQETTVKKGSPKRYLDVNSLDNILSDERVTLIKMSVQGCEEEALRGAERLLQHQSPRLAITIFMKPDALVKIPMLIKSINPNYKLYLRCEDGFFARVILYGRVD